MCAFKCENDCKNKLKGICKFQPKKKLKLKKIKIFYLEVIINKNVISI